MDPFEELLKRLETDKESGKYNLDTNMQFGKKQDNNSVANKNISLNVPEVKLSRGIKPLDYPIKAKGLASDIKANVTGEEINNTVENALKPNAKKGITAEALDKGVGKATQGLELAANVATDFSGKSYDTSAEGGGVRNLGAMEAGSKVLQGAMTGMQIGGPIGAVAGGLLSGVAAFTGNKKAKKEYTNNVLALGQKNTHLDRLKLEQETAIQEGKDQLFDLQAIRKKQLGYV